MQLREEDFDGALLLPWLDAHTAPVAALAASTGAYWNNPLRHPLPHLHRCPYRIPVWRVACTDAHLQTCTRLPADRRELLTAAADGSLALTPLTADDSSSSSRLYESGGAVTFSAARWNGPRTAVTGSLQGGQPRGGCVLAAGWPRNVATLGCQCSCVYQAWLYQACNLNMRP